MTSGAVSGFTLLNVTWNEGNLVMAEKSTLICFHSADSRLHSHFRSIFFFSKSPCLYLLFSLQLIVGALLILLTVLCTYVVKRREQRPFWVKNDTVLNVLLAQTRRKVSFDNVTATEMCSPTFVLFFVQANTHGSFSCNIYGAYCLCIMHLSGFCSISFLCSLSKAWFSLPLL